MSSGFIGYLIRVVFYSVYRPIVWLRDDEVGKGRKIGRPVLLLLLQ